MALLKIIKLTNNVWKHNSDLTGDFILTKFYAKNEFSKFLIVESYGAKRNEYLINEIEVYNIGGSAETFTTFELLFIRLKALGYTGYYEDGTFIFVPADYISDDASNALTIGTDNKFFVPVSGGGTSLRRERYELNMTFNFPASALWYVHRNNSSSYNALTSFSTVAYNGSTNVVTNNTVVVGKILTFNQKVTKVIVSNVYLSSPLTMRLQYYKLDPLGGTIIGVDNHTVFETILPMTVGAKIRDLTTYVPASFTANSEGFLFLSFFNNNIICTVESTQIVIETLEVI